MAARAGWVAKGLFGERHFNYMIILCNPDHQLATVLGRLRGQVRVIADAARLDATRLLMWLLAWAGLPATFLLEGGATPDHAMAMAELAAAEFKR